MLHRVESDDCELGAAEPQGHLGGRGARLLGERRLPVRTGGRRKAVRPERECGHQPHACFAVGRVDVLERVVEVALGDLFLGQVLHRPRPADDALEGEAGEAAEPVVVG